MKVKVTVTVDYEVLESVKIMADETDRSVSSCVNYLLKRALSGKKAEKPKER